MSDDLNERLSAWVDGELKEPRASAGLDEVLDDVNARRRWERYHLIKQSMKGELPEWVDKDFAARVMERIDAEQAPAPARRRESPGLSRMLRPIGGFAVAATVAVVTIVTWQGMQEQVDPTTVVAQNPVVTAQGGQATPVSPQQGTHWERQQPVVESRLNTYLVNHAEYGSSRIQGMLPHARVVGYDQSR
jgi:sigma-E factor negative regulatory protein RseA